MKLIKAFVKKMIKKEKEIEEPLQRALQTFDKTTKSPIDYLK